MTLLELFRVCKSSAGYQKTKRGADWKIIDGVMFFQQTKEQSDWFYNIMSIIRIPWRLDGTWFLFPLGPLVLFLSLKKIIKENPVCMYVGISQGGWSASYASALTCIPAVTFGCPRLGLGSAKLFENVTHYQNENDIIPLLPPWANLYGRVIVLENKYTPVDLDPLEYIEYVTGHSFREYEANLKGL